MNKVAQWLRSQWPRTRRWAKYAAIGFAALFLLILLAYSFLLWHSSRRINREIAAIRALGEPTNWDELQRTGRDGRVTSGPRADTRELSVLYTEALSKAAGFSKSPAADLLTKQPSALSPGDIQVLDREASRCQDAWDLLVKASHLEGIAVLPEDGVKVTQEALDNASRVRSGLRLIQARATLAAVHGQGDAAADACLVGLRCSRAFPGYNLFTGMVNDAIIATMCRTIERTQAVAPCSAKRLDDLIAALERLIDDTCMLRNLCGERVCGSYMFETNWANMPRFMLWPNHAAYLEIFRDEIAAARLPFPLSLNRVEAIGESWKEPLSPRYTFSIFARMMVEQFLIRYKDTARQQARARNALVSLAIRRAKLDGLPPPPTLDSLVPKYLPKIPTDPFSGAPLRYFLDKDECVVYSIGLDRVDNHGSEKMVHTPHTSNPEDIVLRFKP